MAQHPEAAGRAAAAHVVKSPLPPCPCGRGITERHHRDGDPTNNDPSNIELLCRLCHMEEDGRLDALVERNKRRAGTRTTKPCASCGDEVNPLRKGLCHKCNERERRRRIREAANV